MSSMRIAAWARQSLGVRLTSRDLLGDEVRTLDDAAFVIALRYMELSA